MTHGSLGPLLIDIVGTALTQQDCQRLQHPMVGGVILFSRNYHNRQQLQQLIQAIHALRTPRLLVTVDHEGGRVQRWLTGFTHIPPMATLGARYVHSPYLAQRDAYHWGKTAAQELTAIGVDLNFAPVLDLGFPQSTVLRGGRAFHHKPHIVTALARAYIEGLNAGGMQAVGKHFPGHGGVTVDSHFGLPEDTRSLATLKENDLLPFQTLIKEKKLAGIMTAHIIYSAIDPSIASLSPFWLHTCLRQQCGFQGVVISDDLSMKAIHNTQSPEANVRRALFAGCDLLLICNNPTIVDRILGSLDAWPDATHAIAKLYQ